MYIRVKRGRFDPSREDELRRVAEETVPASRQMPGCRSFHLAVDRSVGRVLAVSTWDAREQAEAIGRLRAEAEAVGVQFEPPEMYEVIGQP